MIICNPATEAEYRNPKFDPYSDCMTSVPYEEWFVNEYRKYYSADLKSPFYHTILWSKHDPSWRNGFGRTHDVQQLASIRPKSLLVALYKDLMGCFRTWFS
jgi:hypothetical protein